MYDQIFHWVLLGNYGGFVSKWEGYPQFQWQFQWATLIKMLGRDMDPLRLVFLFFFMLYLGDSNSKTASNYNGIKPGYNGDTMAI